MKNSYSTRLDRRNPRLVLILPLLQNSGSGGQKLPEFINYTHRAVFDFLGFLLTNVVMVNGYDEVNDLKQCFTCRKKKNKKKKKNMSSLVPSKAFISPLNTVYFFNPLSAKNTLRPDIVFFFLHSAIGRPSDILLLQDF